MQGRDHHDSHHGRGSHGVSEGEVGPDRLRQLFHALSDDDRDVRRPWSGTPATWWREGALPRDTAPTVGTVLGWCTMIDDDAGGVRALLLGSVAALAEDGQVAEADLDRLVTGFDAQRHPGQRAPALRDPPQRPGPLRERSSRRQGLPPDAGRPRPRAHRPRRRRARGGRQRGGGRARAPAGGQGRARRRLPVGDRLSGGQPTAGTIASTRCGPGSSWAHRGPRRAPRWCHPAPARRPRS